MDGQRRFEQGVDGKTMSYRGRIAPTPSGFLHRGHARTFFTAYQRAQERRGEVLLRVEDLDPLRSKDTFVEGALEDLRWLGLCWDHGEGPGTQVGVFYQSRRTCLYREALETLIDSGLVYRCYCSRKDIQRSASAPHQGDEGPLYSGTCRANLGRSSLKVNERSACWRFRVPDGRRVEFVDGRCGLTRYVAGKDFSDFVVWRQDDVPSYQLAVTVDDHLMEMTEVVRGEDLLVSTARQLLLYEALGWVAPEFYHCELVTDAAGERLSKRSQAMGIRELREQGWTAAQVLDLGLETRSDR